MLRRNRFGTASLLRAIPLVFVLVGILLLPPPDARAHGDDQLILEMLTEEIAKAPDADLYVQRGELLRHHREWARAEADFAAAAEMAPERDDVNFFRARLLLESGTPDKALPFIDRYSARNPDEAEGWFLRGEIFAALGRHEEAAAEYSRGIERARTPRPEHYMRRARFLASMPKPDPVGIIAAIDEGIARLGPVYSLVELAIMLEEARDNYEAAIKRVDDAMAQSQRRERWLVRRAEILVHAGRPAEARDSYRAALAAIEDLPERHRTTVVIEKLVREIHEALERLTGQE